MLIKIISMDQVSAKVEFESFSFIFSSPLNLMLTKMRADITFSDSLVSFFFGLFR